MRLRTTLLIGLLLSQLPVASFATTANEEPSGIQFSETSPTLESRSDLDGYEVNQHEIEIAPGNGTVGLRWGDRSRATWGSSYATSTEIAFLYYQGKAKAAANVFDGKRIIQVCIWYSRSGYRLTNTVCSNAYRVNGIWVAGQEVSVGAWDTLIWDAPKTVFNIQTMRVLPTV